MTDTPETQPVEGVEILRILRSIEAQGRASGEQLTKCVALLSDVDVRLRGTLLPGVAEPDQLTSIRGAVDEIRAVVAEAAPLLNSGPARALKGSRSVMNYLTGGRPAGG